MGSLSLPIDFPSVCHPDYFYETLAVIDQEHHPVITDPNSVGTFFPDKLRS